MKYLLKGFALGVSLNIAARICELFYNYNNISFFVSGVIFYIIITLFLISDDFGNMFTTGFSGLFFMTLCEICIFFKISEPEYMAYLAGMYASVFSIISASILTWRGIKLSTLFQKGEVFVSKNIRIKLLLYIMITTILFTYLVLPENAGISVPIFSIIQFICLWFVAPDRKRLILYIPIFIMSLNSFISASTIWIVPNCILSILLYCCMFIKFDIKNDSLNFLYNILSHIVSPFLYFNVPFKWCSSATDKKIYIIKRIALALVITIPCTIALVLTLSKADMVFSVKTNAVFDEIFSLFTPNVFGKIIIGFVVSLFFFGAVYNSYKKELEEKFSLPQLKGDLIVINIVLSAMLFVYTMFVIVQFKYLLYDTFTFNTSQNYLYYI